MPFQPGRHVPQGLKPACLLAVGGTAEALHPSRQNPRLPGAPAVPFPKTIYETSSKTLAESEGARSGPREPRKAPPPFLPIQTKKERGLMPSGPFPFPPSSGEVVAIEVHHLVPRHHEV